MSPALTLHVRACAHAAPMYVWTALALPSEAISTRSVVVYMAMAHVVMAYLVMAYIVVAYIVITSPSRF